jgi:membrane-associated phospholipid phosphatase
MKIIIGLLLCLSFSQNIFSQNVDIDLLKNINPKNPNATIWRAATKSAYPVSVGFPVGLWVIGELTKNEKTTYNAYQLAGSVIISAAVTEGLKIVVHRERPYQKYPAEIYPYDASDNGQSFPSAHTSLAFATATSLSIEYKKWYVVIPAYLWATGVGYSRLYLGEHYPTDVVAGAAVGAGSAILSHWLTKKIFKK